MPDLKWTRFSNAAATSAQELGQEWPELIGHLRQAGPYAAKASCPWIKLARFGSRRSGKGSLRHDGNVVAIYGVEGDYDGEQMQPEEAIALLERAQIKAAVYTSPSHQPEAPRWRVLAPLSHEHPAADRKMLLARINGALGGVLSGESFTLSQSYYYGRVQGQADYRVLVTFDDPDDGTHVDEATDLEAIAKMPRVNGHESGNRTAGIAAKVEALGRRLRTGDGRRDLLKTYISDKSNRGLTDDEIRVLVDDVVSRFFDPSDPIDWGNVGAIISSIAEADAKHREEVRETVGDFVDGLDFKSRAPVGFKLKRAAVDIGVLRPVKWVLQGFVAAGEVVVFAGQPGVGKSTVFASLALLVAGYGQQLGSDIENDRPRRVLIVSEHAGQYERLLYGFCHRFGLDSAEVAGRVILFDAARLGPREVGSEIQNLISQGEDEDPPLIVLDTASASFDLSDENSNAEVGAMLAALKPPVVASGSPLWISAHAAKALGREDAEITPRGASAYIGDVHGTGSVFRDKNFPNSTFVKSLKNRAEREFNEIEVRTEVVWHQVVDERGVIQRVGIRLGVPMISGDGVRKDVADQAAEAARAEKANEKLRELDEKICAALSAAQEDGHLLTASDLAKAVGGDPTRTRGRITALTTSGALAESTWPADCRPHHQKTTFYRFSQSDPDALISAYRKWLEE